MSSSQPALPYDLLAIVAFYADSDTLRNMCLASRALRGCAMRELYRHLQLVDTAKTIRCFEVLRDSPDLGLHVRSMNHMQRVPSFFFTDEDPRLFASLLAPAIRSMTRLRRLDLNGIGHALDLIVDNNEDEGGHLTDIFDAIAGLPQLVDIDLTWRPRLAPLLTRLNPLRRLIFRFQTMDDTTGLEHILRTSADTLEELNISFSDVVSRLKMKEPRLVFPRVTRLSLSGCGSLGMELPRAFPHVKRLLFLPSPVEAFSFISNPANFRRLDFLELSVDGNFESAADAGRTIANVRIFDPPRFGATTLASAFMSFLGVLRKDTLRSLELPFLSANEAPATTLRQILGLLPNLEFFSAKLYGVEHPWVAVNQTFRHLRALSLRGVSLCFYEEDIDMLARIVELEMKDLRESLPDLTFLELRSDLWGKVRRMAQFRRDKGMRQWRLNVGVELPPPEDWPFRR